MDYWFTQALTRTRFNLSYLLDKQVAIRSVRTNNLLIKELTPRTYIPLTSWGSNLNIRFQTISKYSNQLALTISNRNLINSSLSIGNLLTSCSKFRAATVLITIETMWPTVWCIKNWCVRSAVICRITKIITIRFFCLKPPLKTFLLMLITNWRSYFSKDLLSQNALTLT